MGLRSPQPQAAPPQGQPQEQAQGAAGGDVTKLLVQVNSGLNQLAELIDKSPLPDEDKQQFNQIMSAFSSFTDSLGQPQGQQKPQQPAPGQVTMETAGRPSMPSM